MRVLKTALRFDDLLAELPELRKAIKFTVAVYYSERVQIKNSKQKNHIGLRPGTSFHLFSLSSPTESVLFFHRQYVPSAKC